MQPELLAPNATQRDPELRFEVLAMKGDVEFQYDIPGAEKTWTEVRQLATSCDLAQGRIAGGVPLNVVDGFEVVDVDESDGEPVFAALDVLELGGELGLNAAAVEGPGQGVLLRLVPAVRDQLAAGQYQDEEAGDTYRHLAKQQGSASGWSALRRLVDGRAVEQGH